MRKTREELIAMLRRGPEGVREFNEYRGKNPDEAIDLLAANLGNTDLRGVRFFGVNLCGACLYGADLSEADLCGANLSYTIGLKRADYERTWTETATTIKFAD